MRKFLLFLLVVVIILGIWSMSTRYIPRLGSLLSIPTFPQNLSLQPVKIVTEESVTIDIVKKTGPSVVTVVAVALPSQSNSQSYNFGPFTIFGLPNQIQPYQNKPQDIGSEFIVT